MVQIRRVLLIATFWVSGMPAMAAVPDVTVKVFPRIGLFNQLQYVRNPGDRPRAIPPAATDWAPLSRADYQRSVHPTLQTLLDNSLGSDWELLTTSGTDAAYKSRHVRVYLATHDGTPLVACGVAADAANKAVVGVVNPSGSCSVEFDLASNAETRVSVTYRDAAAAARPPIEAVVPEDYLIVVAGDSYASGEGNPDRPCYESAWIFTTLGGKLFCNNPPALWMDERCHRSMWAAGSRAALTLIREDSARLRRRGAYTLVNVACSGASIATGLVGYYAGVKTADTLRSLHPELKLRDALPIVPPDIPPQINVVNGILQAGANTGKSNIDLLIVSTGGNDMEFGPIAEASIKTKLTQEWLDEVRANLVLRLQDYQQNSLDTLAQRLAAIPVSQLVLVPYPDVTGMSRPDELQLRCDGNAITWLQDFAGPNLSISTQERGLAYKVLVTDLNAVNQQFAQKHRIRSIDRDKMNAEFRRRGWCASDAGKTVYEPGLRLIRKANESLAYQGNANGTMHPTFEAHEMFADEIVSVVDAGLKSVVKIQWQPVFEDNQAKRTFVRGEAEISAHADDDAPGVAHDVCNGDPVADYSNCQPGTLKLAFAGPQKAHSVRTQLTVIHASSMHRERKTVEHVIDADPPEQQACVARAPGAPDRACDNRWLEANEELGFAASDAGSGVARMRVVLQHAGAETVLADVQPAANGEVRIRASRLPQGTSTLVVHAVDHVQNESTRATPVRVGGATPTLLVSAYGYARSATDTRQVPAAGNDLRLMIEGRDDLNGVLSASYTTPDGEVSIAGNELRKRVDGCIANDPTGMGTLKGVAAVHVVQGSPVKLSLENCAHGHAELVVNVQPVAQKGQPLPVSQWAAGNPATLATLRSSIARMTRLFPFLPNPADANEFGVFSVWLNIADGRLAPDATVPISIDAGTCKTQEAAGSVYALLMGLDDCVAGAAPEKRDALLDEVLQRLRAAAAFSL